MYLPNHYAAFFIFILFIESSALFIYTLIGLLKQNPLPHLLAQDPSRYQQQQCQCGGTNPIQNPSDLNFGLVGGVGQGVGQAPISYITVTTTAFPTDESDKAGSTSTPTSTSTTTSTSVPPSTKVVFTTIQPPPAPASTFISTSYLTVEPSAR